jgi:hypothetical protein
MTYSALLLSFSIGILPIQFLIKSADTTLSRYFEFWKKDTSGKRSLTHLEGIDLITEQRLSEEGIECIQQLSLCDPLEVSFKTKYPISAIKDWKDQAILYLLTADIIVKDKTNQQSDQYLDNALNENYGIKRFSQFYNITNEVFEGANKQSNTNNTINTETLNNFCKGLGFSDTGQFKFRYLIETIRDTGDSLSKILYKNEITKLDQDDDK